MLCTFDVGVATAGLGVGRRARGVYEDGHHLLSDRRGYKTITGESFESLRAPLYILAVEGESNDSKIDYVKKNPIRRRVGIFVTVFT